MGLFKWKVRLGEYGECIADGYAYARNDEVLLKELSWNYKDKYERIIVEEDWEFDEDDIKDLVDLDFVEYVETKIAIRWED